MKYVKGLVAGCLFVFALQAQALTIASWNVKHLGWADEKRDWSSTAKVVAAFDFVALQEVHTEDSVKRLIKTVEKQTGEDWSYSISHRAMGSKRYKEFYAMVWRNSEVKHDLGDTVYLDPDNDFMREPYLAKYSSVDGKHAWTAASIHVIYGDNKAVRVKEASFLDEFAQWAKSAVSHDRPLLIMGDFNLPPTSEGFDGLRQFMVSSINKGKTTLRKKDKDYLNLYDNIWFEGGLKAKSAGIYKFPQKLGMTHVIARKTVSDHAPVFIVLD